MSATHRAPRPTDPTVAAVAAAKGLAVTRSFRFRRPRGAFCGRGWCHTCPLAGQGQLACHAGADTTADVSDPLRVLGRVGEETRPWFYERRFLRPAAFRSIYLGFLRKLPRAPQLAESAPGATVVDESLPPIEVDTLVVGAGPAGLAASMVCTSAGRSVLVVDAAHPGGSWLTVPRLRRRAAELVASAEMLGTQILTNTVCVGFYPPEGTAALLTPAGPRRVRFGDAVIATGAYDRLPAFAGNDLPGVVGLRGFETFVSQGVSFAGKKIGVVAGPEETQRARSAVEIGGGRLTWSSAAGGGDVPQPGASIRRATGRRRIKGVELTDGRRLSCDLLVVGFSQPAIELALQLGVEARLVGNPPILSARSTDRVLVVGEAAGEVDLESIEARVEEHTRRWLGGFDGLPDAVSTGPAPFARSSSGFVCLCEDVRVSDIEAAVHDGFVDVELLKRRTGATTGPCQGKLCMPEFLATARDLGVDPSLPTARPPARPVTLNALAGIDDA